MKKRAAEETASPETLEQSAVVTEAPAPLEQVLIQSDPYQYEKAKAAFLPALPLVQNALDAFLTLNVGPITLEELFRFAIQPGASLEQYVRNWLYDQNETLKAFPQSKASLMSGIELPEGFEEAKAALEQIKQSYGSPGWATTYNPFSCTRFYLVDENNQVSFNWPQIEQELDEAFNKYLTDQEELKAHQDLKQAYELIKGVYDRANQKGTILTASGIIGVEGWPQTQVVFRPSLINGLFKYGR